MAYSEALAGRVRACLAGESGLVEKKMFGGIGFMLDGNLACGVNQGDLIIRVGPDAYATAVMRPHTRPFDFTGRPMKGWLIVDAGGYQDPADLDDWVRQGVAFARTLPAK